MRVFFTLTRSRARSVQLVLSVIIGGVDPGEAHEPVRIFLHSLDDKVVVLLDLHYREWQQEAFGDVVLLYYLQERFRFLFELVDRVPPARAEEYSLWAEALHRLADGIWVGVAGLEVDVWVLLCDRCARQFQVEAYTSAHVKEHIPNLQEAVGEIPF